MPAVDDPVVHHALVRTDEGARTLRPAHIADDVDELTSCKLQAASHKPQATSHKLQAASHKLQAASCKLQATSYKLQATSCKLRDDV